MSGNAPSNSKKSLQRNVFSLSVLCLSAGGLVTLAIKTCPGWVLGNDAFFPAFDAVLMGTGAGCMTWWIRTHSKLDKLFENCKLLNAHGDAPLKKAHKKVGETEYWRFTLPSGLTEKDFIDKKEAIEQHLMRRCEIREIMDAKEIFIEAFEPKGKEDYKVDFKDIRTKGPVEFPIAYDYHDNLIKFKLSVENPFLLVVGQTGSGKTKLLDILITYGLTRKEETTEWYLVDLKGGVSFKPYEDCRNVVMCGKTVKEAEKIIKILHAEVDKRQKILYDNDCTNIEMYNEKAEVKMKYKVFVFDEFAELSTSIKGGDAVATLQSLMSRSRACGIFGILALQRASASKNLIGDLKTHFTSTIGLKVKSNTDSGIVGIDGLEKLRGKGHCIVQADGEETECQCMFISSEEILKRIEHLKITKVKENEAEPTELGDLIVDL